MDGNAVHYLLDAAPIPPLIVWGYLDRMILPWHAIKEQKSIPEHRDELSRCGDEGFQVVDFGGIALGWRLRTSE